LTGDLIRRRIGDVVSPLFYRYVDGQVRHGRSVALQSLIETQRWPLERLRELQEGLLRRLLRHAADTSPWYRERLPNAPELARFRLDDLPSLPILEKSDLQSHLDDIAGTARFGPDVREGYSGGSTGTPVRVYQSQEFRDWDGADRDRGYLWCEPFRFGMPRAFFWGSEFDSRAHRGVVGTARDLVANLLWLDAFSLRRDGLTATVRRLKAYRPTLVVGYVSTLAEIAPVLDGRIGSVRAVVTAAETLMPPQRSVIADAFGAPVFDRYASREAGPLAHECAAHDGLHLAMENAIIEVVGPDGQPVEEPGAEGEILVTSLRNLATPLVRYRLSDVVRLARGDCPCGRASTRLESIVGRTSDVIVSPGGVLLHGIFFVRLFNGTPVRRFRVDQETPRRLRVRVVPSAEYNDEVRRRITSQILDHGDRGFEIGWEVVDNIPPAPSGKFRFTVSHVATERSRGRGGSD
jgi:phenylacetate-CoA ligase